MSFLVDRSLGSLSPVASPNIYELVTSSLSKPKMYTPSRSVAGTSNIEVRQCNDQSAISWAGNGVIHPTGTRKN
jgi:hypothetical protein